MNEIIVSLILVGFVQAGAMARSWVGWKLSGEVFSWGKFWVTFIAGLMLVSVPYGMTIFGSQAVLDPPALVVMCYAALLAGWAADSIIGAFIKGAEKK